MEKKTTPPTYDRRKAVYITSLLLLALLFVVVIVGIFSKKLRPFASENNPTPPSQVTVSGGQISYKTQSGLNGKAGINSVTLSPAASTVTLQFSLQAVNDMTKVGTISGHVQAIDPTNTTTPLIADTTWSTTTAQNTSDKKARIVSITDTTFFQKLSLFVLTHNGSYKLTFKPDNYLSQSVEEPIPSQVAEPIVFPAPFLAGDLNNDNVVNEADVAIWVADFNKPVTDANQYKDFNHDGKIDEADVAIAYTSNFNKTGQ